MYFRTVLVSFVLFVLSVSVPSVLAAQPAGAPLTLGGAVDAALEYNPEVRRAREQVDEFNLRVRSVRADALPRLDFAGAFQRTRDPGLRNSPFFSRLAESGEPLPPGALDAFYFGTYFYQVEVEQPVYQFGRVGHALAAARQELEGVQTDVRTVENRVALDVAQAYYDLLLARARREVLEAERRARERQLQQVNDQLELGEATRLDSLQAGVALANLRPEVLIADNAIRVALTRLNETLGREPLEPFEPADVLGGGGDPADLPAVDALLALAAGNRPELRRYALSRRVLEEAEGVVRADTLPEISARASLGINSFQLQNLGRGELHGWNVGVNFRWTLFDGQRTTATIGQYRSQRRQNQLEEQAFRARLARDLERAAGDWQQARETIEVAALAVDQGTEARRVAEELFSLGAATFLNVLDAERALRQAELVRLQAYHGARSALAEIKALVGFRPDAPDSVLASSPAQVPVPVGIAGPALTSRPPALGDGTP
jgi:outer membrane protein TolC